MIATRYRVVYACIAAVFVLVVVTSGVTFSRHLGLQVNDVQTLTQQSQAILSELRATEKARDRTATAADTQRLCIARAQAEGLAAAVSVILQPPDSLGRLYATLRLQAAGDALNNIATLCPLVLPMTPTPTTTTPPGEGTGTSGSGAASTPFLPDAVPFLPTTTTLVPGHGNNGDPPGQGKGAAQPCHGPSC
jgi:hypothetical protein